MNRVRIISEFIKIPSENRYPLYAIARASILSPRHVINFFATQQTDWLIVYNVVLDLASRGRIRQPKPSRYVTGDGDSKSVCNESDSQTLK